MRRIRLIGPIFCSLLALVPAAIFLVLWMVILSAWLAPWIDQAMMAVSESACGYDLTTQCRPVCEYRSQKGCRPKPAASVERDPTRPTRPTSPMAGKGYKED